MQVPSPDDRVQRNDEGVGPLIGIIVIVLLFVAGGIYFLVTQEMERRALPPVGGDQALL